MLVKGIKKANGCLQKIDASFILFHKEFEVKRFLAVSIVLFLAAFGALGALDVGDDAANFVNPDLTGEFYFARDYIGKGWVLIDFFATWCAPCQEELPELEALYGKYSGKGLSAFLFSVDAEGDEVVKPFFRQKPTAMTVLIDKYMVTMKRYGVEGIPVVFLVNPQGKIVVRGDGYDPEAIAEMDRVLSEAL